MIRHETINDIFGWSNRGAFEEPSESSESDDSSDQGSSEDLDFMEVSEWDQCSPELRSYELVKRNVERRCFRVAHPHGYVVMPSVGMDGRNMTAEILTVGEMKDMLREIVYFRPHATTGEASPHSFYPRWKRDVTIRAYEGVTFAPGMPDTHKYNLWRGYKAAMLPPVPDAEANALAAPFYHHIRTHCAEPDYVIGWIAKVLHRPEQRTNVGLLFHGEPGARVECLPDAIRKALTGPATTFQTYAHKRDVFDKGARQHLNKTLIQMDGLSREDFQLRGTAMSELITSEELTISQTWRRECTDSYVNVILTSCTIHTLAVEDPAIKKILCTPASELDCKRLECSLADPRAQRAVFQAMMRHV
jgi:hypothetical protein